MANVDFLLNSPPEHRLWAPPSPSGMAAIRYHALQHWRIETWHGPPVEKERIAASRLRHRARRDRVVTFSWRGRSCASATAPVLSDEPGQRRAGNRLRFPRDAVQMVAAAKALR